MLKDEKKSFELTAEEAMAVVESFDDEPEGGEREIVGAIFDRDEVTKFLEWLTDRSQRER